MPIRIGLHPAAAPRLHADWNASQQSTNALIKSVQLTAERLVRTPFNWVLKVVGDFRRRLSLRDRIRRKQNTLIRSFDDRYEQLVDLMCSAAQGGCVTSREGAYKELRMWMRVNYGSVRRKLQHCYADQHGKAYRDPFESLLSFDRLEDVLTAPSSIDDMMLCRKALDEYCRGLGTTPPCH